MKIQCDLCNKDEASLFCSADEAALCDACDHRVHHANNLASNHQRFSLHHPPSSSNQHPLCDVCLGKSAFVFCQQDRAILCEDCDLSIHSANEHTKKHNRFLLTGVKLSTTSKSQFSSSVNHSLLASSNNISHQTSFMVKTATTTTPSPASTPPLTFIEGAGSSTSTSSISQYLIETLPGWQVEDFLDSSNSVPFSFSKSDDMLPMFDADIEGINLSSISVPQAPPALCCSSRMDRQIHEKGETKENTNIKGSSRSRSREDSNFIVPQIRPDSNSKRPRFLW